VSSKFLRYSGLQVFSRGCERLVHSRPLIAPLGLCFATARPRWGAGAPVMHRLRSTGRDDPLSRRYRHDAVRDKTAEDHDGRSHRCFDGLFVEMRRPTKHRDYRGADRGGRQVPRSSYSCRATALPDRPSSIRPQCESGPSCGTSGVVASSSSTNRFADALRCGEMPQAGVLFFPVSRART
jgi:hypothetical protein